MTQEEINKRNEAIALFMGAKKTRARHMGNNYWMFFGEDGLPCMERTAPRMEYKTNWSWIMPVVEKISKLTYEDGDQIYPRTFAMSHENGSSYLFRLNRCELVESESLIESVFIGVSDFCLSTLNK